VQPRHSSTNRHEQQRAWSFDQRAYPLGYIPKCVRTRALSQIQQSARLTPRAAQPLIGGGPQWVNLGPAPFLNAQITPVEPTSGRAISIAVDPTNNAHWLIGSAMGGIWETRDTGVTWTPKTDDQASLAIGALAFAPSNPAIIYAGTGEPNYFSQDDYYGAGLLKSADGGVTWQLLAGAAFSGLSFSQLAVNPTNSSIVLAALTGGGSGRGGEGPPVRPSAGVFKSTNGGTNWLQKLSGFSTDLKADPGNFNHLLATLSANGASSFTLYQSLNAGDNWTAINGPWAALGASGRMQLAISPSSPNTAYVSVTDANTSLLGIWRTDNAWAVTPAWTQLPQPQGVGNQLWYDHVISVDPASPNILYFGETPLWKYNGTTWATLGGVFGADGNYNNFHPDQHAMAWTGSRLIFGNDGGVWSTTNGGASIINHNTNNLSITQLYYGAVHPQGRSLALSGAQDNGTEEWTGTNTWLFAGPGDGAEAAISPNNPDNNWVVSFDKLNIFRETGAGQFQTRIASFSGDANVPFIGRLALAPTNENVMITGSSILHKSTNIFSASIPTFYQDCPDLGATITALAFAPSDLSGNTYAFATENAQILLTSIGAGYASSDLNAGGSVPSRYVTQVAFQPNNANVLYVTLSGFDEGTPGKPGHVFKTANALAISPTWANVSPPVDLPCNAIALDPVNPNNVYVGTDIGVWKSTDGGGSWTHQGPEIGMPNVAVFDLKIQPVTGRIFAFTHGRGTLMYDPNAATDPPTITSFNPTNGPAGTGVTIAGTKFNNATAVQFAGVNAATFVVNSSTQIVATVPVAATTGAITVTTPGGTATSAANFNVTVMTAITGFTPVSGNVGTVVTISGANFTGATSVKFNGTAATTFTVNSATQITATVPSGATSGKISVTTPNGTAQSASNFTVTTLPVISGFSPASGAIGSSVVITGANFVTVTGAAFNGTASSSPTVNSSSQITATVPAGATTGPISVTTTSGTGQSAANFTVIPAPTITSLVPTNGSAGTVVTITGNNFSGATAVTFNGVNASTFSVGSATQINATAPSGVTTGPIHVTTPGGTAVSAASFVALTPPGNDNFASAQNIGGTSGSVTGTNTAATKEPGEPAHAGNGGGKSIWYRWTAPSSGTWTFNTVGSTFDTLLAVYTGSVLSNLVLVASNDNIPETNTSSVSFNAANGTVYQIAVDGFLTDAGEGAPAPAAASGTVALNWNLSANLAPQISSFTPPGGSTGAGVTIAGVNFTGATGVTFNGVAATFTLASDQQITTTVPAGAATGPIQVVKSSGTATSAASFVVGTGPINDNFANAQVISGGAGTVTGGNAGASKEAGEPNHAGNVGGASVWYVWTAPSSGNWRFDTFGSSFDTLLGVYTGSSVSALSLVVSNDDAGGGLLTSQVFFNAVNGTTYHIAVDGYGGVTGNVVLNWANTNLLPVITGFNPSSGGAGTLVTINGTNFNNTSSVKFSGVGTATFTNVSNIQLTAAVPSGAGTGPISITTSNGSAQSAANFTVTGNPPPNDNFSNRIAIAGAIKTVTGSNIGATKEAGEPNHAGNAGGASVWWTWTAPSNGTYTITTRDSSFDTTLGVYTGSSVSSLSFIASNDDGPNMGTASLVSFFAISGTAYQIAVDGYNAASDSIVLSVYPVAVGTNIYYTGFESYETSPFFAGFALAGQGGWTSFGPGTNGILYNAFGDYSQQAYLGYFSYANGASTYVWHPLNYTPSTNTLPVVVFSTYMEIVDSTTGLYDDFGWDVFNQSGQRLFFLNFDNYNLGIYYELNDGAGFYNTGQTFQNGYIYYVQVTMDFGRNTWSATLNGTSLVQNQPLSATNTVARNLGDIDARWRQTSGTYGDNYMVFDNYYVSGQPSQAPRIITPPQNTSVTVGNNTNFLVVADSPIALSYQWQFNGAIIAGATAPTLALNNVTFGQAGSYTVIVTNSSGSVTSAPALLTVTQLPNLTPYKPAGWSDKIVAATNGASTSSSAQDAGIIYSHQDIYVNWAVINNSSNGNITVQFYSQLYVDGILNHSWFTPGLNATLFAYVTNYDIGKLPYGIHTLRIDTDTTDVVPESNKNDNSYTKTIIVSSTNSIPPLISSPSRSGNGPFQFTLSGIPLRTYQIQASTNFTNWSVLATLVNSNGTGVLPYSDPTATNFARRFYRSQLLSP
jgi:hypothetical protein